MTTTERSDTEPVNGKRSRVPDMARPYIFPYSSLRQELRLHPRRSTGAFQVPFGIFLDLLRRLLIAVPLDEHWYNTAYPGIAGAIQRGVFVSPVQHFITHGYFEGRQPRDPARKDAPVLPRYKDLAAELLVSPVRGGLVVELTEETWRGIIRRFLAVVPFDEAWYRARYAAVPEAVGSGQPGSARRHFIGQGYFDQFLPFEMGVDEEWYLATYPELRAPVLRQDWASAQAHFNAVGYAEARLPGPWVAQ
jgi:hypothetical protein